MIWNLDFTCTVTSLMFLYSATFNLLDLLFLVRIQIVYILALLKKGKPKRVVASKYEKHCNTSE